MDGELGNKFNSFYVPNIIQMASRGIQVIAFLLKSLRHFFVVVSTSEKVYHSTRNNDANISY